MTRLNLDPEKAHIFRIVHRDNLHWIYNYGIQCRNSNIYDPNFVEIGKQDIIQNRQSKHVPIPPGGTLSDYVPFYFTPSSIMLYNIISGHGGVKKRDKSEIVILVSSLHRLNDLRLKFIFTNQHACSTGVRYFDRIEDLKEIDWALLQSRNFKTNDEDPGKQVRYQAEALVHSQVPLNAISGIGCFDEGMKMQIEKDLNVFDSKIPVKIIPKWYF
ncbi:DUF4433 domain-containing protein [Oscillatoria amoena NRMC-F 0135]|nr:DUF4433 domain-containing protein [Oscillatoria amoena NRMC-F 0135]MDL5052182.1 DUF4433 domain-containing protein [Oscillatoria laete-virens NRMC-F 0139]